MDNALTQSAPATMQVQQGQPAPNPMMPQASAPQGGQMQVPPVSQQIEGMNMSPQQLAKMAALSTYTAGEMAALARKPDLDAKDVVNAAGQAIADGHVTASDAVKFLAGMPQDAAQLRPWVNGLYMHNLAASVHLKAAILRSGANG